MRVSEIFESIQGEGDTSGRLALFIRLQGCPLDCVWCDTKYSVPFEGGIEKSVDEISRVITNFSKSKGGIIVFTGGEPLYYQDEIDEILKLSYFKEIEFETSGIYIPKSSLEKYKFNVSPKLPSSKLSRGDKIYKSIFENLRYFVKMNSIFKFVVSDEYDLSFVENIIDNYGLPKHRVFLMPQGTTAEELVERSKFIIPFCLEKGLNYSFRLQVILKIK
ncbi:MAG: 7-carboxy-7-deazaguanine synthase QueE [Brevinematales bacterium]|nr:7-carboxy-7-deazaguanine synthase QueE [Brevinematales bacterium]